MRAFNPDKDLKAVVSALSLGRKDYKLMVRTLNNQRFIHIHGLLSPDMLDTPFPIGAQEIESEAVQLGIDFIQQLLAEQCPLGWINDTLEY